MNKTSISCHQTGVLAGLLLLVLKITSLPSLMHSCSEVGGVVSITVYCVVNIAFLALIIKLKKTHNNKSMYEIFCGMFGKIFAKIIYFMLFTFFIFKLLALVDDGFGFVRDIADDEFEYINFVVCFFPVICALAYSGIRNMSRTCEFFFPFVLIGLFVSIVFSYAPINFWGLGSISRFNFSCLFRMFGEMSFWNGDLFVLLIFMDYIDLSKGKQKQIFMPVIYLSIFLILSYVMYFSLYQETAILHSNMIFDIIEYSVGTSSGWHMDIVAILVYTICLFLQGAIYIYACLKCFEKVFNFHNKTFILFSIVLVVIAVQFLYLNDYLKYIGFANSHIQMFSTILVIGIPISVFLAIKKGIKNERVKR